MVTPACPSHDVSCMLRQYVATRYLRGAEVSAFSLTLALENVRKANVRDNLRGSNKISICKSLNHL